jgi:uncharacterized repeat protein (TIGR03806 family)
MTWGADARVTAAGRALWLLVAVSLAAACTGERWSAEEPPERLSAYGLFENAATQTPAPGVLPYRLNTPLFSDYASKYRFVKLPVGAAASYRDQGPLEFPVGTVLAKTFAYPAGDDPARPLRLIETRILIHGERGWVGLPYLWNQEQTEAWLEPTGGARSVEWQAPDGRPLSIDYRVPNLNQCKGCHRTKGREMSPIGPQAGQLNGPYPYPGGTENQLAHWRRTGALAGAPEPQQAPRMPVWNEPASGTLDQRARAWLDINCAHCHNPEGPARTSGLDLSYHQEDPARWGVGKSPVAAGRGSGDRLVDIAPGDPEGSILLYRLESLDPGEMMPELGRSTVHVESVDLIRDWIAAMGP